MRRILIVLGVLIAAACAWEGFRHGRALTRMVRGHEAEEAQVHAPTHWPDESLAGDVHMVPTGALTASVTTWWNGVLNYSVSFAPARKNGPALAQLADSCRFSLQLNQYDGSSAIEIPLAVTPNVGVDRVVISLEAFDQTEMSEETYANLVGLGVNGLHGNALVTYDCR